MKDHSSVVVKICMPEEQVPHEEKVQSNYEAALVCPVVL